MKETSLALALSTLAFMMTVIWGSPLVRSLRYFKIGKLVRVEGPDRTSPVGTPTMGGVCHPAGDLLTVQLNAASLLGVDVLGRSGLLPWR